MKRLREIITNPVGIALLIVLCGLAAYCLIYENVLIFFKKGKKISFGNNYTPIYDFLVHVNYLPLFIIDQISSATSFIFGRIALFDLLLIPLFFILVALQWLSIGYLITKFIESNRKAAKVNFSLKNE